MRNHWQQYLLELVIGLIFTAIWFVVFRFLILKFDFKTPGREDEAEIELDQKKNSETNRQKKVEKQEILNLNYANWSLKDLEEKTISLM